MPCSVTSIIGILPGQAQHEQGECYKNSEGTQEANESIGRQERADQAAIEPLPGKEGPCDKEGHASADKDDHRQPLQRCVHSGRVVGDAQGTKSGAVKGIQSAQSHQDQEEQKSIGKGLP